MGTHYESLNDDDKKVADAKAMQDYLTMPIRLQKELNEAEFRAQRAEDIAANPDRLEEAKNDDGVQTLVRRVSTVQGGRGIGLPTGRRTPLNQSNNEE